MRQDFDDDRPRDCDARRFRRFSHPDGSCGSIDEIRHNGWGVPAPNSIEMHRAQNPRFQFGPLMATYRIVMEGLNRSERRLFGMLLRGTSIMSAARVLRLTRQAIYSRIRGDRKSCVGMIGKSKSVRAWWEARREEQG